MSRAFTKESDGQDLDELPERVVSAHRNLVTPRGMVQIEERVREFRQAASEARAADDRTALARSERDLRYWTQRLASAEVVRSSGEDDVVRFGSEITLVDDDDHEQRYRIVGEDEADPREGCISYVSPLASLLIGARVGDTVRIGSKVVEITSIQSGNAQA
jgi:transcription elongation GreA/GreB family factor